jgi:hypothetical protein
MSCLAEREKVVECMLAWLNRFRRWLIRWEKKVANYLALLHFACAWISFRAAELFGSALILRGFSLQHGCGAYPIYDKSTALGHSHAD